MQTISAKCQGQESINSMEGDVVKKDKVRSGKFLKGYKGDRLL